MASFLKDIVGGIINAAGANINPYRVQSYDPVKQQRGSIVESNGCVTLYRQVGCLEAVLYNSDAYPSKTFSLFRLTNEGESCALFRTLSQKIVALYTSTKKIYQDSVLQQICDAVREHPTWSVAHVAAHVGLVDAFHHTSVKRCLNMSSHTTGLTPLMLAVKAANDKCVEELLEHGAKIDMTDADGNTAFHMAILSCPKSLQLLAKADTQKWVLNWVNGAGETPLHVACKNSKPECTKILLCLGADVNTTSCDTKPIHEAIRVEDIESARLILEQHPDQIDARDNRYNGTPAHWAKTKKAIDLCIENGCDMTHISQTKDTPLNIMLERSRIECVTSLICHGVAVNQPGKEGNTPLHLAVLKDDIGLVKSLLVFGADTDILNDKKQSARHLVATSKVKNKDAILYVLHLAGAKRCNVKVKGCQNGCVTEGKWDGSPDQEMKQLQEQTKQDVDDMLDEALCATAQSIHQGSKNLQRVLCLDGGGIRGIVLIQMLLAIEKAAGQPIKDCFDWIGGTSTGGILAIGIAIGKTLQQLLGMYFGLKDKVFVGGRPYPSKPLEDLLKKELGETIYMSDIDHPKILVTAVLADRFPPELHFFKNYTPPKLYRPTFEGPLQSVHPPPNEQLAWQAARCSGAAPTYFRACGPFLDGGLMSNNPTLDILTEIHEYNSGLKSKSMEVDPLGVVVSLGTGIIPTTPVKTIDVFKPGGLVDMWKSAQGVSALLNILQDQATVSEGRPNDRARAWCSMINVPYYRLSPQLSEDVALDAHDDRTVLNMMWETQCFIASKKARILQLASILRGVESKNKN